MPFVSIQIPTFKSEMDILYGLNVWCLSCCGTDDSTSAIDRATPVNALGAKSTASTNVDLANILLTAVQYDVDSREDQFKFSAA